MRFTAPLFLILLLALPIIIRWGRPSRGPSRRREMISLALRMLIVAGLIFSLAGLEIVRASDALAVVFLIDASDSMSSAAKAAAVDYTRQAIADMGPDDQAAVVVFGGDALVERGMSPQRRLDAITSIPDTGQTDLAEAIRLALALYPPGAARRMVILSDGAQTTGDALEAARFAAAGGVEIVSLPFVIQPGAEALVTGVEVPARLRQGERFDMRLSLQATQSMRAGVRILAGDRVVYQGAVDLNRGSQSISIPLTAGEPGFVGFVAQIDPERDGYYQNNALAAFAQVQGPPKVLVVALPEGSALASNGEQRPDEYSALVRALEASSFVVEMARPAESPSELSALAEYVSIVLVDVPARELNDRQVNALQSYVRDLGGGLVAVGGPTSYGVGGYYRTPLEETLPVEMAIKDEKRRPSLAIVFIIDHSGSMADRSGGVTKLELAKEAATRSVELLLPRDRAGVVIFDDAASWAVPMTDLSDPVAVIGAIGGIQAGGGTDILAGLQAMARVLPGEAASIKHVILLTDGGADPTGIPELVRRLHSVNGITLTTIGVGRDAAVFLPQLAEIGGGRYRFVADPGAIPSIFAEETSLVSRSYLVEETFFVRQRAASPILSGIDAAPPLHGYVATSPKVAAQTILVSGQDDPILAAWQYGLGKAVAFTSDASGRWAQEWIGWEGFPRFWAQAVRYTAGDLANPALSVQVEREGEDARLIIDARDESGNYLNGYTAQARIVAPGGEVEAIDATQIAPGRYTATFRPHEQGAYLIGASAQSAEGGVALTETAGWVMSYSPEYGELESDPDALYRLTLAVNGRIASDNPADVFGHTLPPPNAARPVWPWLLTLAALLLPFDIGVRRLAIGRADVERAWAKLKRAIRPERAADDRPPERSPGMETLLRVKERTRAPSTEPIERIGPDVSARTPVESVPPPVPDQVVSTTAALLERKRSRRDKQG